MCIRDRSKELENPIFHIFYYATSLFVSYRPQIAISKLVQYLKGTSSRILLQEFAHLRKQFWGRHFWGRGYMAVSSGNITDELIAKYIDDQEGEPVDYNQFQIDGGL